MNTSDIDVTPRAGSVVWFAAGRPVTLGAERGRGGEACVFTLPTGGVAKLFHSRVLADPSRSRLRQKIEGMIRLATLRNDARFAWPCASLYADATCTTWVGFAMRELQGVGLHALLSLTAIRENLPGWNRLHLTRAAIALFDVALELEKHGILIGDVSPGNFLVDYKTATVAALDCDSYQLHLDGICHRTSVHTPRYLPPEMLDKTADAVPKTSQQVVFSLGLLAYEFLTLGQSVYAHTWGDDPFENLRTGKTVMGGKRASGFLPIEQFRKYAALHPAVKRMCVRTFVDGHGEPAARPTLAAWREALRVQFMALRPGAVARSA